jgi:hypothetical protein
MSDDRDECTTLMSGGEEMRSSLEQLRRVDDRLAEMEQDLDALRGRPCEKCSRREGDAIIGRRGDPVRLVGGYEATLCRACQNAWTIAADESGHWLEYRKATEHLRIARTHCETSRGGGVMHSIDGPVEALVAAERKLFHLAMKWLAGGTP